MHIEKDGLTFKTSFCEKYEELLIQSQEALEMWSRRQEEILRLGLHGTEVGSELIRLQANFAKAYTRLQSHIRECVLCQLVSRLAQDNASSRHFAEGSTRPA